MSQLSRKISDEITGNSTSKSQKNSRTGDMAGAGSGQQERMQVRPGSVGAYGYGKCNEGSWSVDRTHRRLRHRFILQGVPHRSDRPILNHGAGLRTLTSQPLNTEGIISEEVFDLHTTRSEKVRQTRYRCHDHEERQEGQPLTPITRPYCSWDHNMGEPLNNSVPLHLPPPSRLQGVALRDGSTYENFPRAHVRTKIPQTA